MFMKTSLKVLLNKHVKSLSTKNIVVRAYKNLANQLQILQRLLLVLRNTKVVL